ncbi:MAG: amidohydrolase family protein [Candidatus Hermodarchaeota archaeon]
MDIAIINTWLMTFEGKGLGIIPNGSLGIEKEKITFVGRTDDLKYKKAEQLIDGTNKITMPGLINAHTHTGLTLFRGAAQDLPEIEWMNQGIGPFIKHLNPEDVILGSKLGVMEALKSGTTTLAEYTSSVSTLIDEVYLPYKVRVVGIETINEVISDRTKMKPTELYEFDQSKGDTALKRAKNTFREFKGNELVSHMYGPQAMDMVSLDTLLHIKQQAVDIGYKIHMHVAQGERERLQIKQRFGNFSTVKVLERNDLLDTSLIAAHIHDTAPEERSILVEHGVSMVGCPTSISMIDGIIPPLGHYVQLGGKAAIGTDQAPGTGHHNLFREMRTASILTKVLNKDPTALPPWQSLKLATRGGAEVLGLESKIGSLSVGKQADVITIDLLQCNLTPVVTKPFRNFVPNLIYSTNGNEVDNVIINGQLIMKDSQFLNIDEDSIISEANKRAPEIYESATEEWMKANSKMVDYYQNGYL